MTKKNLLFILIAFVITITCYLKYDGLRILYIRTFKISTVIGHKNQKGQYDGDYSIYAAGKIYSKGHYSNGLRDGPESHYYENGQIKNKKNYKNGRLNGKEYEYFENGQVKYRCIWKEGKKYGDLYYYFRNGQLDMFHSYDITGEKFNVIRWDSVGRLIKHDGFVISPYIYSKDKNDSVIILQNKARYNNINDFYVTISTPNIVNIQFFLKINNKRVSDFSIIDNTLEIKNAFKSNGIYNILIGGELIDKKGGPLERDFVNISIEKF